MAGNKETKLKNKGVMKNIPLKEEEQDAIETLSDEEVDALISSYEKLEAAAAGSPTRIINF